MKMKQRHQAFLASVELLKGLDQASLSKVVDAVRVRTYATGQRIINAGEDGKEFFIIEEGSAVATKDGAEVCVYQPGDYFGELALLKDQKRAADVTATHNPTVVVTLDRSSFKRLLGPLE